MSALSDPVEIEARRRHASKCLRSGIHEPELIASYWETCDQEMYREQARRALEASRGGER